MNHLEVLLFPKLPFFTRGLRAETVFISDKKTGFWPGLMPQVVRYQRLVFALGKCRIPLQF
jgi:hypothetical protein